jgi:hypothetical protein
MSMGGVGGQPQPLGESFYVSMPVTTGAAEAATGAGGETADVVKGVATPKTLLQDIKYAAVAQKMMAQEENIGRQGSIPQPAEESRGRADTAYVSMPETRGRADTAYVSMPETRGRADTAYVSMPETRGRADTAYTDMGDVLAEADIAASDEDGLSDRMPKVDSSSTEAVTLKNPASSVADQTGAAPPKKMARPPLPQAFKDMQAREKAKAPETKAEFQKKRRLGYQQRQNKLKRPKEQQRQLPISSKEMLARLIYTFGQKQILQILWH